jgi:hypothetical protein
VIAKDGMDHTVYYRITVKNNSDAGVTLGNITVVDPILVGCDIAGQVPATLASGATFTVECEVALNCSNLINGVLTNTVTVAGEVVAVDGVPCITDKDGKVVADSSTCWAVVECKGGACISRTIGYWFTHWRQPDAQCATLEAAIKANGNKLDLGYMCLSGTTDEVLSQALGMFWSKRNSTSTGRGTSICRARKQLAIQLIGAIANTALLGTDPSNCSYTSNDMVKWFPSDLISQAQKAAACGDIGEITKWAGLLGAFNESGDNADLPEGWYPCKADPRGAKMFMVDPTTKETCGNTDFCGGTACD